MRLWLTLLLAACGPSVIKGSHPQVLSPRVVMTLDTTPKAKPRLLSQEPYLRAYTAWFGGLAPLEFQSKARPNKLFDAWDDYLAALGLPDYRVDLPRASESNALMTATMGRLAEALCVRAAERDLDPKTEPDRRVVFTFDATPVLTREEFQRRFDVLHKLFLSYPSSLAPVGRVDRFFALYRTVATRAATSMDSNQRAWAAVCVALLQHPEARVY